MAGYWRHLCLCIALSVAAPLCAAEDDPPGRIGRISLANEGVHLRVGDSVASGETVLNWPLTTGALIETASGARTEARIGSTTLRIDGGTSLEFLELSDERIWLRLNHGSVILGIQNPEHAAETALDTLQGRLRFDAPGSYRADVAGGTTAFSVYSGSASIEALGLAVRAGDRVLLLGGDDRNYLLGQAASDGFRHWALARDELDARAGSRYVSPEMTGYEDLDRYGSWRDTVDYGPAWFPQGMPLDWAPYRWGHWSWVSPWGWTWIDHAPWGFAPFHYGRWVLIGSHWAWLPGAYTARPVYAPALVVWLGQPGWNMSFSFGSAPAIGWFPLGPREIYYPYYRSSLRHVRNINVAYVPKAAEIVSVAPPQNGYRHIHRNRAEAVTVVPEKTVLSGAPVNRSIALYDKRVPPAAPIAASPPAYKEAPVRVTPPGRSDPARPATVPQAREPQKNYPPARAVGPIPEKRPVQQPIPGSSEPLRLPPPQRPAVIAPSPEKHPMPQPSKDVSVPAWRTPTVPRQDVPAMPPSRHQPPASTMEPMRQQSIPGSSAPKRSPPQQPAVIAPNQKMQAPAVRDLRDEGGRVQRPHREQGGGKAREPGPWDQRNPK